MGQLPGRAQLGPDPLALQPAGAPKQKTSPSYNARLGGVLPIAPRNPQGRTYALHPQLAAVQALFASGRVAVVSNVGTLVGPTSKAAYLANAVPLPPKLFSHNDQASVWQSFGPEGTAVGWGGAMADLRASANTQAIFSSISTNGSAVWSDGRNVQPYQLGLQGPIAIGNNTPGNTLFTSAAAQAALLQMMRTTREDQVAEAEHAAVVGRSVDANNVLSPAMPIANMLPWGTPNLPPGAIDPLLTYIAPDSGQATLNPITAQLQPIARMIAARAALGMGRQVFFVGVDGWDTHDTQNIRHADLLAQLAQAMSYWDNVTRTMGVDGNVTTFTASDFGRSFASNDDGTDHGWGSHHFVMGGAVKGGDLYGTFPAYGAADGVGGFTSPDQLTDGVLLPSTSVEQYAATLGRWFGLSDAELAQVLPNLANWSVKDLGFMAA